jgi:electron transport complex protein RnfG
MEQTMDHGTATGGFRNSNLVQAWLVLVLALCFGASLAAVQINLSGRIAENKRNETLSRIPGLIWGTKMAGQFNTPQYPISIETGTISVEKSNGAAAYPVFRVSRMKADGQKEIAGWVLKGSGRGYADKIELLIGLDPHGETITGLFILEQKETPGLGNKIMDASWRAQFIRKMTISPLKVVNANEQGNNADSSVVDAITGATISSRAVTRIVNGIIINTKGKLVMDQIQWSQNKDQRN